MIPSLLHFIKLEPLEGTTKLILIELKKFLVVVMNKNNEENMLLK